MDHTTVEEHYAQMTAMQPQIDAARNPMTIRDILADWLIQENARVQKAGTYAERQPFYNTVYECHRLLVNSGQYVRNTPTSSARRTIFPRWRA